MEIQNYNQRYEQAVVDLWNACLPCDPLTLQKFRKQALLDDNFDPSLCYVALADQEVVGFLLPHSGTTATCTALLCRHTATYRLLQCRPI